MYFPLMAVTLEGFL